MLQISIHQGCLLIPVLFGLFLHGLDDNLQSCAKMSGMQLGSGLCTSHLLHAIDVVVLLWSVSWLQLLLDRMDCFGLGLRFHENSVKTAVFKRP